MATIDEGRSFACKAPETAYEWALNIDYASRNETRTASCECPETAYIYA
jgi:hypothetical protein